MLSGSASAGMALEVAQQQPPICVLRAGKAGRRQIQDLLLAQLPLPAAACLQLAHRSAAALIPPPPLPPPAVPRLARCCRVASGHCSFQIHGGRCEEILWRSAGSGSPPSRMLHQRLVPCPRPSLGSSSTQSSSPPGSLLTGFYWPAGCRGAWGPAGNEEVAAWWWCGGIGAVCWCAYRPEGFGGPGMPHTCKLSRRDQRSGTTGGSLQRVVVREA
jgi:hypothetical protein